MEAEALEGLKQAIEMEVRNHIGGLESFQGYRIHEIRSVSIENRWFEGISTRTAYSGNDLTFKTILGSIDINYITSSGAFNHSTKPISFAISELLARYNPEEETFEVLGWKEFHPKEKN